MWCCVVSIGLMWQMKQAEQVRRLCSLEQRCSTASQRTMDTQQRKQAENSEYGDICLTRVMLLLQVLQSHFDQLKQHLLSSRPEDFGLDKDSEWNLASAQGALHQSQAGLLLGCLEVMIEDVVAEATGKTGT